MVTSRDVARAAGVSQATVSRVLRGAANVDPRTRDRVLAAIESTRYQPNAVARAMRTRSTATVGVVVSSITNPFYPQLLEHLTAELSALGRRMVLWNAAGSGETDALEALRQGMVDGVLFTTVTAESAPFHEALRRGAPVVALNRTVAGAACDQVSTDNAAGGAAVARYFLDAGHRRIGLVGGPAAPSTARDRERGFRAALRDAGVPLDPDLCRHGDFSHADGRAAVRDLLALPDPPSAVFCVNDLTALGVLDGARSLRRRVPEDLWVVGYDDIAMAAWDAYDLTTVRQPMEQLAAHAVRLLAGRLDDPALPPRAVTLPGALVVRGSTAHHPA